MGRSIFALVLLLMITQTADADYWSLVETTTKVKRPAPNDMMQGSIEGSGSGMTSRLVNPAYWVQKGGTFETSAKWGAPPAVLIPGRKIRLHGAIDVQRNGLNQFEITNYLRLGGHRGRIDAEQLSTEENIFTAAVTSKGAQRDSKSGEWQVPDLSAGQIWITAYVIGAGTRAVIYSYRPVAGEPPPAVGTRTMPTPAISAGRPHTGVKASPANLALKKQARQSSLDYGGAAERAVDGNRDGNYSANSVSHTGNAPNEWWEVDLGGQKQVSQIRLWNRTDCCSERLSNFYVMLSSHPFSGNSLQQALGDPSVWKYHVTGKAGREMTLPVAATGRYVRIQLAGQNWLSLAEVEVIGAGSNFE